MHRLEDLRHYGPMRWYGSWDGQPMALAVHDVDANGFPNTLVRVELRSAREAQCLSYQCECGYEFVSWEEAKNHIVWDDQ